MLAVAPLEIAQLYVDVALLLPPDGRNRLVDRLAVLAMATPADLKPLFNALRLAAQGADTESDCEHNSSAVNAPVQFTVHQSIPMKTNNRSGTATGPAS